MKKVVSKSHESRASGGRLCCDVGNDHLGVGAFFGSYFDDDNSHFDLNPRKKGSYKSFCASLTAQWIQINFEIAYSKASRYTASRSADLGDTRFLIGSQNT